MRKTLLVMLTCVLALMFLQQVVFADMGAPEIEPYQATISNVNGAKYYNPQGDVAGEFEYGEVITVSYEFEEGKNKEVFAHFLLSEDDYTMYTVNIENIEPLEKESKAKYSKTDKVEITILKEDGIEILKGPAYAYEKTGVIIPKGKVLTGYRDEKMGSSVPWLYVTYEGTSGWICELNGTIGHEKEYKEKKLLMPRDTNLYKDSDYTKPIAVIPANTIIKDFLEIDDWSQGYYVEYDGVSGYLSMGYCAVNFPWLNSDVKSLEYVVNYPEVKLYKEARTDSEILIDKIPEGEKLEYFYGEDIRFTGWIYTSYNNISGWVYYIEDGSVYKDYIQYANDAVAVQEAEKVENDEAETNTTNEMTVVEKNEVVEKEEKQTMISATQIVILCAMFGVTIAVTSIVTIALVNRKKK